MSTNDAGARSFAHLLTQVDDGRLHAELSEELRRTAKDLADYSATHGGKAKGSITLVLSLTADRDGTVSLVGDVNRKVPKSTPARTITWLDPAGNLVLSNPKQMQLGVREVPAPAPVRTIEAEKATVSV